MIIIQMVLYNIVNFQDSLHAEADCCGSLTLLRVRVQNQAANLEAGLSSYLKYTKRYTVLFFHLRTNADGMVESETNELFEYQYNLLQNTMKDGYTSYTDTEVM